MSRQLLNDVPSRPSATIESTPRMVTAAILEYPFSGSIAVSSSPFDRADLNQAVQANP